MDPIEGRRAKRKNITLKGSLRIKDGDQYKLHIYKEPIELTTDDVSGLGCGFVTSYFLPKGVIINVRLKDFPRKWTDGVSEVTDIEFSGKVMYCRTTPSRMNRVGLQFTEITKECQETVNKYVTEG